MKRFFVPAAAAVVAAFAATIIAVALPAGAATHPVAHRPAICRILQHARTDGTHSLRFYTRKMDGWPSQVLMITGRCESARQFDHARASVLRYHDFSRPFPANFTLFGPL